MRVESLPDVTDFFATLQSPVTPLLPSFWAGESLFAGLQGGHDWLHGAALWTTACAFTVLLGAAAQRWHFAGYSRSQEAPKARVTQLRLIDRLAHALPMPVVRQQLLIKDLKVFLRDVSQWLQLLPLVALVLLYLYNFQAINLERIPYMSGVLKNVYAFLNMGLAGFVMTTVAVRFVFSRRLVRGRRVLGDPDVAGAAARLPVVEVLDGAGAAARVYRAADDWRRMRS
jgi:ABC-2 type transport system permease protein